MVKISKTVISTIAIIMILISIPNIVCASSATPKASGTSGSLTYGDIKGEASGFISKGEANQKIKFEDAVKDLLPIGQVLVGVATIAFLVTGSIMGVKYMMSGANEKAQLKQKLIWFVVAMVLVYGAVGIYNLVVTIMSEVTA